MENVDFSKFLLSFVVINYPFSIYHAWNIFVTLGSAEVLRTLNGMLSMTFHDLVN